VFDVTSFVSTTGSPPDSPNEFVNRDVWDLSIALREINEGLLTIENLEPTA
jgi:hypothetical protein